MNMDLSAIKDWVYIVSAIGTICFLVYRLRVDTKFANYRETISYLEKRNDKFHQDWEKINQKPSDEKSIKRFLNELDLVALLVLRKGFDEELVYNYWWKFFYEPMYRPEVKLLVENERRNDKTVFENYLELVKKWKCKIQRERDSH